MSNIANAAVPRPMNIDTTQVILEELSKLGDPLPVPITQLRPSGLYSRTMLKLQQQADASGKDTFSEADFRSALRQVIRELTDPSRDRLPTAAEQRHTTALETKIIAAATDQVLQEQGKADDFTQDEYMRAVAVAKRRTRLDYGPPTTRGARQPRLRCITLDGLQKGRKWVRDVRLHRWSAARVGRNRARGAGRSRLAAPAPRDVRPALGASDAAAVAFPDDR